MACPWQVKTLFETKTNPVLERALFDKERRERLKDLEQMRDKLDAEIAQVKKWLDREPYRSIQDAVNAAGFGDNIIVKNNLIYDSKGGIEVNNPVTPMGILLSVIVAGLYGRQRVPNDPSPKNYAYYSGRVWYADWTYEDVLINRAERALAIIPRDAWREYHTWLSGSKQRQAAYDADSVSSARDFVAYRTLKELID